MNKVILMGRLTKDPTVRYSSGDNPTAVARYTLAVDRRFHRDNEQTADFISCVAFGRSGEFAEKYLHQGTKIVIEGRIQTGRYTNKDGQTVFTTDVVIENQEFAESKAASQQNNAQAGFTNRQAQAPSGSGNNAGNRQPRQSEPAPSSIPDDADGFMDIPDGIDEELPFQ